MKKTLLLLVFLFMQGWCMADVFVQACDPNLAATSNREMMLGKSCPLLVYSDANDLWSGGLFIWEGYRHLGSLHARDKDPNSRDWAGSHLSAAGLDAQVIEWNDSGMSGFDFYNDIIQRQTGHWFVVDYRADKPGTCRVNFFQHSTSWTVPDPNQTITFTNIVNRDFNQDNLVNLQDFDLFSQYWLSKGCTEPSWCGGADLDQNGDVGVEDAVVFAEYWLWGTPNWQHAPQTTESDPNLVFAVVDVNDLSEITLLVGSSTTLYITKQSDGQQFNVFSLEAILSDPNLGSIDNTEIDPNALDAGASHILVSPRDTFFDYYGPGYTQYDGIYMLAVSLWETIGDGALASFVYTAEQPGDVVVSLINYDTQPARLESILIHQITPPAAASSASVAQTVELLEDIYDSSEELQTNVSEEEWNSFIESVAESTDPNQL